MNFRTTCGGTPLNYDEFRTAVSDYHSVPDVGTETAVQLVATFADPIALDPVSIDLLREWEDQH